MNTLRKVVPAKTLKLLKIRLKDWLILMEQFFSLTLLKQQKNLWKNSSIRDNFPVWAEQANGMLQFAIWSLLAEQGLEQVFNITIL